MSNVRALISRTRRQRFRINSARSKTASHSTQMQSELRFAIFEMSVSERRFAHLVKSINGLRFARLNSQKVGVQRARSSSPGSSPVRLQRATYCEVRPRFARFHSISVRHRLRAAPFPLANSVRFGHQRPNPSVEGTAKRLRLLSAPHLER
jgi:hypothetical protein